MQSSIVTSEELSMSSPSLLNEAKLPAVELRADGRPDLRAQILAHPDEVDPAAGGLQRPAHHLEQDFKAAAG